MPQYRLMAGSHIGPDSQGVVRQWTANGPHSIIDTNQDLTTLNARGFSPKFQPLHADTTDEASLLAQKAEIEAKLASISRDKSGGTPSSIDAPVQPNFAPQIPMLRDPRDLVSPHSALRDVKATHHQNVMTQCERMNDQELLEYCQGEEIEVTAGESRADMLAAVSRVHA
jgi:hypothetical protein